MIYRHPSLGNRIQIAVVKLIILKPDESFAPKEKERISASEMLKAFCLWQNQLRISLTSMEGNVDDENPTNVFDVALLLTRYRFAHENDLKSIHRYDGVKIHRFQNSCYVSTGKISAVIQPCQVKIVIPWVLQN